MLYGRIYIRFVGFVAVKIHGSKSTVPAEHGCASGKYGWLKCVSDLRDKLYLSKAKEMVI